MRPVERNGPFPTSAAPSLAEEALRESEERYRLIAEMVTSFAYRATLARDQVLTFQWVVGDFLGITGYQAEELTRHGWFHLIHPDDLPAAQLSVERLWRGETISQDLRIISRGGAVRWVRATVRPFVPPGPDEPLVTFGAVLDITERKTAEETLRLHSRILEHLAEGVHLTRSQDGIIVYTNPAFERIFGYGPGELIGKGVQSLNAPGDPPPEEVAGRIIEAVRATGTWTGTVHNVRQDGSTFWCWANVTAFEHPLHGPLWVTVQQDITEQKRIETELQRQQAELLHVSRLSAMGQLVASLSHELAQPLSAIGNFSAACLALVPHPAPPESRAAPAARQEPQPLAQYLGEISRQSKRAGEILKRLRDFTRKSPAKRSSCDLNVVIRDSVELTANELRRRQVAVRMDLAAPLPLVSADRIQLQQVIVNLLTNAADAMADVEPALRVIHVLLRVVEGGVVIDVGDQGTGIRPELIERVFEPFYTTKPDGMGIGLGICRSIVHDHGGKIEAFNNPRGGATFRVRLPCAAPSP